MQSKNNGTNSEKNGAFIIRRGELFLSRQKQILERILIKIREIADHEAQLERVLGQSNYADEIDCQHPSNIFLVDGQRGSGKTSLILTFHHYLQLIGVGSNHDDRDQLDIEMLKEIQTNYNDDRTRGNPDTEPFSFFRKHDIDNYAQRKTCLTLPVINPDNMEVSQTIMETIFALIRQVLKERIEHEKNANGNSETRELLDELQNKVAKGWYFSKSIGVEALLNDSLDFQNFIKRQSEEAFSAHDRMTMWRKFVHKLLDHLGYQLLVIFIDDTDISHQNALDVLTSQRIFLTHPKIVAIHAGNLYSIRHTVLTKSFEELSLTSSSLRSPESYTAQQWRNYRRYEVEEVLEKIVPRHNRNFISLDSEDYKNILKRDFSSYCSQQMQARINYFVKAKQKSQYIPGTEAALKTNDPNERHVENYMAFWLLRDYYQTHLSPKSVRHLNQFRLQLPQLAETDSDSSVNLSKLDFDKLPSARKRVAVVLFSNPDNFQIIQRVNDHDEDLLQWLWRNSDIAANWRGAKYITLGKQQLAEGTYSYDYLLFRIDHQMALPYAKYKNPSIPKALLPVPSGNLINVPEVWESRAKRRAYSTRLSDAGFKLKNDSLRLAQDRLGIARLLDATVIPGNCCYFKDVRCLPDIAWNKTDSITDDSKVWPMFPVQYVGETFDIKRFDTRWDYFHNVVLLFASFPLIAPVPADEFFHEEEFEGNLDWFERNVEQSLEQYCKKYKHQKPFSKEKLLQVYGNNEQFFEPIRQAVANQIRIALYSLNSGEDKLVAHNKFSPRKLADKIIEQTGLDNKTTINLDKAVENFTKHIIPKYHRLLNDVRMAYHARRIFENDLNSFISPVSPDSANPNAKEAESVKPFTHSIHDGYQIIGIDEIYEVIQWPILEAAEKLDDKMPLNGRHQLYNFFVQESSNIQNNETKLSSLIKQLLPPCAEKPDKDKKSKNDIPEKQFLFEKKVLLNILYPGNSDKILLDKEKFNSLLHSFINIRNKEHLDKARVARSTLLFLYAIGPCLCSLIHIDINGSRYSALKNPPNARNSSPKDEDKNKIGKWQLFIRQANVFALFFSLVCEEIFFTDESELKDLLLTLGPDISVHTLGIRTGEGEAGEGNFSGMIQDIFIRLHIAQMYLEDLSDKPSIASPDKIEEEQQEDTQTS